MFFSIVLNAFSLWFLDGENWERLLIIRKILNSLLYLGLILLYVVNKSWKGWNLAFFFRNLKYILGLGNLLIRHLVDKLLFIDFWTF